MVNQLVSSGDLLLVGAGLAMDADTDFHLVLTDFEAGLASSGNGAGSQSSAHGTDVVDDLLCNSLDFFQRCAFFSLSTGDLVDEDGTSNAAAAGGVQGVLNSDVVVGNNACALDAVALSHFSGHFEVHDVTGVVLDDQQNASVGSNSADSTLNLVRSGRGEDSACNSSVQHALANVAAVCGLVTGTTAGDQGNLAFLLLSANQHVEVGQLLQMVGMGLGDAFQHFQFYVLDRIDEFLHKLVPPYNNLNRVDCLCSTVGA